MTKTLAALCLAAWALSSLPSYAETITKGKGTVITVGEDRVVVQKAEGGQITLEARFTPVNGKWVRSQACLDYMKTLKQGDQIEYECREGEGNHFMTLALVKQQTDTPENEMLALKADVASLRGEMRLLREMVERYLREKK